MDFARKGGVKKTKKNKSTESVKRDIFYLKHVYFILGKRKTLNVFDPALRVK